MTPSWRLRKLTAVAAASTMLLLVPRLHASQEGALRTSPAGTGQVPAGMAVQFQFDQAAGVVPFYTIVLNANGDGSYTEGPVAGPDAKTETPLHVGPATLEKVLAGRASVGGKPCETKLKHIANTGRKTLSYGRAGSGEGTSGSEPAVSCVFNYSDLPVLNDVASTFIALAETMQAGERLIAKHRFDRLGLDLEMESLNGEVKAGRALEVENIRPVLNSIINDDRVIERVRRTAARLLQNSASSSEAAAARPAPGSSDR